MREGRKEDPYDSLCVLRVIFATFAVKSFSSNGTLRDEHFRLVLVKR